MRTSLGIASNGLLDRGGSPALHIASMGLLRIGAVAPPAEGGGGGVSRGKLVRRRRVATEEKRELLKAIERKLTVRTVREVLEPLPIVDIDIDELKRLVDAAFEKLPAGKRKVDLTSLDVDEILLPSATEKIVVNDLNLRLLLLLSV